MKPSIYKYRAYISPHSTIATFDLGREFAPTGVDSISLTMS